MYIVVFQEPPVVKVSPCKGEVEVNKEEDKEPEDKSDEPCKNGGEGSSTSPSCQEKVRRAKL